MSSFWKYAYLDIPQKGKPHVLATPQSSPPAGGYAQTGR